MERLKRNASIFLVTAIIYTLSGLLTLTGWFSWIESVVVITVGVVASLVVDNIREGE